LLRLIVEQPDLTLDEILIGWASAQVLKIFLWDSHMWLGPVHHHRCSRDLFCRARDGVGLGKPAASLYRKR